MLAFTVRRMLESALVMLIVALLAFLMFTFLGDPVEGLLGEYATSQDLHQLRERLGLNDPIFLQFGRFIWNILHGDFGISYQNKRDVWNLISERFPATLEVVVTATIISLSLGISLGVYSAINHNSKLTRILQIISLIGISLPTFVTGILLIMLFSVTLNWLPSFGRGEVVQIGWWSTGFLTASGLKALIMPAITLSLFTITLMMRLVRAEMLEVLRTDYIKFAHARGLTNRQIHFGHALRNTLMPVVTIAGLQFASLIAYTVITETVFQWPGMGFLFIQAVNTLDIPVMAAYLVLVSALFVLTNLIVDLLYVFIDPRLRTENKGGPK